MTYTLVIPIKEEDGLYSDREVKMEKTFETSIAWTGAEEFMIYGHVFRAVRTRKRGMIAEGGRLFTQLYVDLSPLEVVSHIHHIYLLQKVEELRKLGWKEHV